MGVAGCGKSTVGELLARRLGCEFHDGDDHHPPANIAKMSAGTPLGDADRFPWLDRLRALADTARRRGEDAVIACSALRGRYRERLAGGHDDVRFVYLRGDRETIGARLGARREHFMRADMLDSQFAALEEPEDAIVACVERRPEEIVAQILEELGRGQA